jgi:bifunctional non-homologous end joining protein LigD
MPTFIDPMKATLTDHAFSDPDWLYEVKWDGYRIEAVVDHGVVKLWTRNQKDGETYFPGFLKPASWIDADQAIVDGEVVALDPDGRPDFGLLQERISGDRRRSAGAGPREAPLVYQAFDLLYLDGRLLTGVPLEDRKRLLRSVLKPQSRVRYAAHVEGEGVAFFRAAEEQELEGIIAKHRRSLYEPGRRSKTWLKVKVRPEQELVVGGYLPGEGAATELGALVVGTYEDGKLRYGGRVGSGFDTKTRRELRRQLDAMVRKESPFDPTPPLLGDLRDVRWVEPTLVIRAEFSNWTRDNLVRQAAFKGFDRGKDPRKVIRERPMDAEEAEAEADDHVESTERAMSRDEQANEAPTKAPTRAPGRGTRKKPDPAPAAARATAAAAPATRKAGAKRTAADDGKPQSATPAEIAALDAMVKEGTWSVGGAELRVTNLDKVLFDGRNDDPKPVTKRDLIRYFALIAPVMLPHLADRPLNLHRFPNGANGPAFWQKDIPKDQTPPWLRIWHETGVGDERKANTHVVADQVATLCWLGNLAAFEIHGWTAKLEEPWRPTFALIDIDPGPKTTWDQVVTLAKLYRTALDHLGVRAYPKVTGRRGIQAWIPIEPRYDYQDTSAWVESVSKAVGAIVPDLVSWEWSVANRKGLARLDYTQNAPIKTLVAPYAVRPAAGAPVSAPITWDELDDPDLRPDRWTIRTLPARVARLGDLFAGAITDQQVLPKL